VTLERGDYEHGQIQPQFSFKSYIH